MAEFAESRQNASSSDVFKIFHEKYIDSDMNNLCNAYKNLCKDKCFALKALSIKSANCLESVSFSQASVVVEEHLDNWYPFGIVFLTGLKILRNFLQDGTVPQPDKQRDILSSLLTYLLDTGNGAISC